MGIMTINQAMRSIKDEKCCKCGRQAKGLVYRGQAAMYYCKDCLHDHIEQKNSANEEPETQEAAAG